MTGPKSFALVETMCGGCDRCDEVTLCAWSKGQWLCRECFFEANPSWPRPPRRTDDISIWREEQRQQRIKAREAAGPLRPSPPQAPVAEPRPASVEVAVVVEQEPLRRLIEEVA